MEIIKGNQYKTKEGLIVEAVKSDWKFINGRSSSKIFEGIVIDPGPYEHKIGKHSTNWSYESFDPYKEDIKIGDNYEIY